MTSRYLKKVGVTLVTAVLAAGTALPAAAHAPSRGITVRVESVAGSGCPTPASATVTPHLGEQGFTIAYQQFAAVASPQTSKFCNLVVRAKIDGGLHIGLRKVTYRGTADLVNANASFVFEAKYHWLGQPTIYQPAYTKAGPFEGDWEVSHTLKEVHWGPCQPEAQFDILQNLKARGGAPGASDVVVQTTDAGYAAVYEWVTERCV
ncbi:hypothetical protein GCM10010124_19100 [Pilimelia terevasa]|uniref:DUF4360 domain-containing protein n=1 Tax=Pilimelia terevasa TaxID=53372 RepID=A0A8J3BTB7_9ACTN|nr:DUF4360 domain-containing protein [Pilimelia terevasa]GGK26611.1 hypothetical protein GCM10010124_19100 [Pilimelia terevasa]